MNLTSRQEIASCVVWSCPDLAIFSDLGQVVPSCAADGSNRLRLGIDANTHIFKRLKLCDFEADVGNAPPSLWFGTPRAWREKIDPLEAAVVPVGFAVHPQDGRCDTLCCSWSVLPNVTGESGFWDREFGRIEMFNSFACDSGCIVVAKLGDVLSAMKTEGTVPEARVMLRLEEIAGIETQTSGFWTAQGDIDYTGWPLVYKREAFAEEREIRFVLKRGDYYLKGNPGPRMEAFGWERLNCILLVAPRYQKYYRAICDEHRTSTRRLEFGLLIKRGDRLTAVRQTNIA